jgi:hypothetical protein
MSTSREKLDKKISSFLTRADELTENLLHSGGAMKIDQMKDAIIESRKNIKLLQSVMMRLVNVSNLYNKALFSRSSRVVLDPAPDNIDILFEENEVPIDGTALSIGAKVVNPKRETKHADDFVPRTELVYRQDKGFRLNLSGMLLEGEILDIVEVGRRVRDAEVEVRSGSWVFCPEKAKGGKCRRVGGKMTIEKDINRLGVREIKEELSLRKKQLMHDILVCLSIEKERVRRAFE